MISGINPASQELLNSINITQQNISQAQAQISSGVKISQASDDPQVIADLLTTRADLAQVKQVQSNLTSVQNEVQTADSSVQSAVQLLQQAVVLATQGANTLETADERTSLAAQVTSILQQMVSIGNTKAGGSYIFSGDQTSSPPYEIDPSNPNAVIQLVNSPATRLIQDPTGLTFAASLTAQQLFDARDSNGNPTSGNAFSALENLQMALASGNTSAIQTAASGINSAQDYLNLQSTFYGDVENRISTALNLAQMFQTQDTAQLSSEQDTDVAAQALQMTQDTTQLDAAMAAAAKQPTTSLFNYFPSTTG